MEDRWWEDVLGFWFEELEPADWFRSSKELDERITSRFGALLAELSQADLDAAELGARRALAAIIVLDQFSRNVHRGSGDAFAQDAKACALTRAAHEAGLAEGLSDVEQHFMYMPLMHSERLEDQDLSIAIFETVRGGAVLDFAVEHRDIIVEFGRFPYRNRALGRESTPEELVYLEGAKTYGQ